MKRFALPATLALAAVFAGGCVTDPPPRENPRQGETGFQRPPRQREPLVEQPPAPPDEPRTTATQETPPDPQGSPAPTENRGELPYGKPVQGKAGYVTSPYAPASGYVDVRGFPPATEVRCPYTQKVFLVP